MHPCATPTSERHLQALSGLSHALGRKDGYTQAHSHRVAEYAMRLARRLGFTRQQVRHVGMGGLFHDVGKLALSDQIFSHQKTRLPRNLRHEVRCHPLIGAALIKEIPLLGPVVDFVLFHHEREDGKGYPFGLTAAEIPAGAKIVSIADCFDAVTTDRPYQKRKSIRCAFDILRNGCGRYFYEAYVEAFIQEIEENGMLNATGPNLVLADELIRSAAGDWPN